MGVAVLKQATFGALAFLTRVPVGSRAGADMALAAPLFGLVGAAIGLAVGGAATLLAGWLPALAAGALAVALELSLTGALHVDALADSADGLAGRSRAQALAIMQDHGLGAYGSSALTLDLLIKAAALAALADGGEIAPVVGAYAVSRVAALPLAAVLPPARPGEGVGRLLAGQLGVPAAAAGVLLAVGIAVAATGWRAAPTVVCLAVVGFCVGTAARRRLGGVTGDTLGAATELTATLALVVAAGVAG